jgi:hypothetical protein
MSIFTNKTLSQKLERTEALTNADFVEARAKLFPLSKAEWIEVAGTYAMFDGVESPLTQTFGLGIFEEITDAELDKIETFFKKHNAPVFHEVSPMADASLLGLLNERGYQPCELTNVMFRSLDENIALPKNPNILTRIIGKDEIDIFAETAAKGWSSDMPEFAEFMRELATVGANSKSAFSFITEIDSVATATGTLFIFEDVAQFGGASTIPEFRNQGCQNALLAERLNFAKSKGCTIAMMGAMPGSQSQINAEKNGFRIAYTRIKWMLKD